MMDIRQIAKAFDMKINEFAEYIGYTRQTLYCIPSRCNKQRARAAIQLLGYRNQQLFEEEIQAAKDRFEKRLEAIEALEKVLVKDGE